MKALLLGVVLSGARPQSRQEDRKGDKAESRLPSLPPCSQSISVQEECPPAGSTAGSSTQWVWWLCCGHARGHTAGECELCPCDAGPSWWPITH